MISVKSFIFSPFQENTYVLYDSTNECVIIDPGCYEKHEKEELSFFIIENNLQPKHLLNTHCHIDHVFGNKFIAEKFNLGVEAHKEDLMLLKSVDRVAQMYGMPNVDESPEPSNFLEEGDKIIFGESELDVLFVPGHSLGHVVFVNHSQKFIIGGDVLFHESIGRTDLPGGDHNTLITNIKTKLFTLNNNFEVYSGHGLKTTIGHEKMNNPFLQ